MKLIKMNRHTIDSKIDDEDEWNEQEMKNKK